MNNTARKAEIIGAMPSFAKDLCSKAELLPEMFQLQTDLVNVTFNDEHAGKAQLRIWDVYNHLAALNQERGNVADELLAQFGEGCKIISNCISGEISGNRGESKALRSIETVRTKHVVLRNVELALEDRRTEIDIVVFTGEAVFLVEVKNPMRDIIIDERGNYSRISNDQVLFDKNIGEKMNDKVYLLRRVLQTAGIEDPNVVSLVVFTNNNISVTNQYPFIQHCYLSSLPHLIDGYNGETIYGYDLVGHMVECVKNAQCTGSYPVPLDVNQFKQDFAELLTILEETPVKDEQQEEMALQEGKATPVHTVQVSFTDLIPAMVLGPVGGLVVWGTGIRRAAKE